MTIEKLLIQNVFLSFPVIFHFFRIFAPSLSHFNRFRSLPRLVASFRFVRSISKLPFISLSLSLCHSLFRFISSFVSTSISPNSSSVATTTLLTNKTSYHANVVDVLLSLTDLVISLLQYLL